MNKFLTKIGLLLLLVVCSNLLASKTDNLKECEFRGVWIQCVNDQFEGMGTANMQRTLSYQLDELQKNGVNAIIFQVRAECDALYQSSYEPWSRFLAGVQGRAPYPFWDPLQWMVEQCHQRGMKLCAWINPYRAKTKNTSALVGNHIAIKQSGRAFSYAGQFILNPGDPTNRGYIYKVADDIVRRYDVDGLYIDDYFYPYPVPGEVVPDGREFQLYNNGLKNVNGWRRYNVNLFIKELEEKMHQRKPWVKFGVSPFGIYHNKRNDPTLDSNTRGLQNYDDLYADVLLWMNKGWVDYCVPQLYWQIGHPTADYDTFVRWWNRYVGNRPLYIGGSVDHTAKYADLQNPNSGQLPVKFRLHEQISNVKGTVLWYAKAVVDNVGNYGTALRNYYQKYPTLQPEMPFIDSKRPEKPRKLRPVWTSDGYILFWTEPRGRDWDNVATKYMVHHFNKGERVNLDNPSKIVAVTTETMYKLPYVDGKTKYRYVVTALDRMSNESKAERKSIES